LIKITHTGFNNNFDLIRLFAALQVVVLHYIFHFDLEISPIWEPITTLLGWFPGVPIFFVVSGYLVSKSLERSPSLYSYAVNRFLRIFPALWVCLAISLTTVLLSGYWTIYPPIWSKLLLWVSSELAFGHIYSSALFSEYGVGKLNGSLWTIPIELQFYLILPFIFLCSRWITERTSFRTTTIIVSLIAFVALIAMSFFLAQYTDTFLGKLAEKNILTYLLFFVFGWAAHRHNDFLLNIVAGRFLVFLTLYIFFMLFYAGSNTLFVKPYDLLQISLLTFVIFSAAYTMPNLSARMLGSVDIS